MKCNCKLTEIILGVIILIFALWATSWSGWIITIAAVLLILHALMHKKVDLSMKDNAMSSKKKKR